MGGLDGYAKEGSKEALMSDVVMTDPNETTTLHMNPNDEVEAREAGKRAEKKRSSVDSPASY